MIVKLFLQGRYGRREPLLLAVDQVVVCQDNGTPLAAAAEHGPRGAQRVACACCADDDFNSLLAQLGEQAVSAQNFLLPPPPVGARLLAGPRPQPQKGLYRGS